MDISLHEYAAWILNEIKRLPQDVSPMTFIDEAVRAKTRNNIEGYMEKAGFFVRVYFGSSVSKENLEQFDTLLRNYISAPYHTEPEHYAYEIARKLDILDDLISEEISLHDYAAWIFWVYITPECKHMEAVDRAIEAASDSESIRVYMKEAGVRKPARLFKSAEFAERRQAFYLAVLNDNKYACYISCQLGISVTNNNGELTGIDDSGARISYGEGKAVREPADGKGRFDLVSPFALTRLAKWYELGAKKYADRNWEKGGIPFSRYLDSAMRHLIKFQMGMIDEDHLAAAAWNIFSIMHFQELGVSELDDMPHYTLNKGEDNSQN